MRGRLRLVPRSARRGGGREQAQPTWLGLGAKQFPARICAAVFLCAVFGCARYAPLPLPAHPALASSLSGLALDGIAPGTPLSVRSVERLALLNSPDLQAAETQRAVAGAQIRQAALLANPTVTGALLPLAAGPAGSSPAGGATGSSTLAWNAGLSYDLKSLIMRHTRRQAAEATAQALDATLLWRAWQTIAQSRLLCVQIMEGDDLLGLLREQERLLKRRADASRAALQRGDATLATEAPDVTALQSARAAVFDQERLQLGRRHQLNALLGLAPAVVVPLAGPPDLPLLDPQRLSADLDTLANRRPDLTALRFGYAAQDAKLRGAILAQFPNLTFGVTGGSDNSNIRNVGPQISLELPVFDHDQAQIAIESATRAQLLAEYRARLAASIGEVQAMLAEMALLKRQLQAAKQDLPGLERDAAAAQTALAAANLDERAALDLINARLAKQQQIVTLQEALMEQTVALATLTGAGLPQMRIEMP